jgi:hypothetical protein
VGISGILFVALRYPYKEIPLPDGTSEYLPLIPIQLKKGAATTSLLEVIVDSGSGLCIFNVSAARPLNIADITIGEHSTVGGIAPGQQIDLYEHEVRLVVGSDEFKIKAYFSPQLEIPGLLGREGFFDKFTVTFHPDSSELELIRFHGHN